MATTDNDKPQASLSSTQILRRWALLFVAFNALILVLLSQQYTSVMKLPSSGLSWTYYISLTLGHFSFLIYLSYLFILLPAIFLWPNKIFIVSFGISLMSIITTLMLIDTIVYSQYRFHLSPFIVRMILDTGDQVIGFSTSVWTTTITIIVCIFLLQSFAAKKIWQHQHNLYKSVKPGYLFSSLLLLYLFSHVIHIIADANQDKGITSLTRYYPLLNPATANRFMVKNGWANIPEKDITPKIETTGDLHYPLSPIEHNHTPNSLNILFIIIDSWRFDAMSEAITPNIFRLSEKSLNFINHYSGANDTRTGIFSIFYGLPGNYWHSVESNQISPVLIDTVIKKKYHTGIFASAPLINPEFDRTVFKNIPNLEKFTKGKSADERDKNIVKKWKKWIREKAYKNINLPFFSVLFFDSIHAYQYPDDYPRHFTPTASSMNYLMLTNKTDTVPLRNMYNNITHFIDNLVGDALHELELQGLANNTIVIITGDHGQELNDNKLNYWGHNSNFSKFQTKVPMIISWPNKKPQTFNQPTSHYDLTPTLMNNALQVTTETDQYSIGRDLFDKNLKFSKSVIMTNFSMISVFDTLNHTIMVKDETGIVDFYDKNYQPTNKKLSTEVIKQALTDMRRFYK